MRTEKKDYLGDTPLRVKCSMLCWWCLVEDTEIKLYLLGSTLTNCFLMFKVLALSKVLSRLREKESLLH